jgi:hypothetical protein
MSMDIKELRVGLDYSAKKVMYLAKELLLQNDLLDVVCGNGSAPTATRSCETLIRLNYVTYDLIRTETNIIEGNRRTRLVMRLKKTSEFQRLYDENQALRKEKEAGANSLANI